MKMELLKGVLLSSSFLFFILNQPCGSSASKKQLSAPCSTISALTPDSDSSYEEDDEDEESHIWDGTDHMYRRSVDVDPLLLQEDECDENHNLQCMNGTCQIYCHPEYHFFDSIRQKCLGKAGHVCGRHGKHRYCVPNAKCILSYCDCEKGYGRKDGYCVEASNYKESCSEERPCDKKSGMDCIKGKCECSFGSENQWYDPNSQTCFSYPEGECTSDALCANNTFCSVTEVYHESESQVPSIIDNIYVKKCQCSRGYILSEKSKSCLASWGSKCHTTACHENFKCAEGRCQCHNPSYQAVDNTTNQCVSLVGSHCSVSHSIASCVSNAECLDGICSCEQGYTPGKWKKCLLDFGQPCQYTYPLSNCNHFRGLTCSDGICSCFDSVHVYNNRTQSCTLVKQNDSDMQMTNITRKQYHENFAYVMASSPQMKPNVIFLSLFSLGMFLLSFIK